MENGMTTTAVSYSIHRFAAWNNPGAGDPTPWVEVVGVDHAAIPVHDLRRSINFYERVFGFRVSEDARDDAEPYVLLRTRSGAYLALHPRPDSWPPTGNARIRCSFVVAKLDRARESLWNLGVPIAEVDDWRRTYRWPTTPRSLLVDDPDGHRIELVETGMH
jgi:catechol 2,3-dioxygenase-like lactoylglutathione lyase family enzyme